MLSLFMFFIVFGTLLPAFQYTQQAIHLKKEKMIAYETMHEGAKQLAANGAFSGQRKVNGTIYQWEFSEDLCVSYENYKEERQTLCLN